MQSRTPQDGFWREEEEEEDDDDESCSHDVLKETADGHGLFNMRAALPLLVALFMLICPTYAAAIRPETPTVSPSRVQLPHGSCVFCTILFTHPRVDVLQLMGMVHSKPKFFSQACMGTLVEVSLLFGSIGGNTPMSGMKAQALFRHLYEYVHSYATLG
jgi:hypothetical protein